LFNRIVLLFLQWFFIGYWILKTGLDVYPGPFLFKNQGPRSQEPKKIQKTRTKEDPKTRTKKIQGSKFKRAQGSMLQAFIRVR